MLKKNKKIIFYLFIIFSFVLFLNQKTLAQSSTDKNTTTMDILKVSGKEGGFSEVKAGQYGGVPQMAGLITFHVLSIIGIIFTLLVVYAGYLWLTSRGNSEQVKKAKDILTTAIIGIFIIFGAQIVTNIIYRALFYSAA